MWGIPNTHVSPLTQLYWSAFIDSFGCPLAENKHRSSPLCINAPIHVVKLFPIHVQRPTSHWCYSNPCHSWRCSTSNQGQIPGSRTTEIPQSCKVLWPISKWNHKTRQTETWKEKIASLLRKTTSAPLETTGRRTNLKPEFSLDHPGNDLKWYEEVGVYNCQMFHLLVKSW